MSTEASAVPAPPRSATADQAATRATWRVHPQVAVRPEPFGALLYHYGTRRLTFVKDRRLLAVLQALDGGAALDDIYETAGVAADDRSRFDAALERLAGIGMLVGTTAEVGA